MNLYWKLMSNSMMSNTAYRFNTFVLTANRLLGIVVQVSLWTALYRGADWETGGPPVSLPEMTAYIVFGTALSILIQNGNIYEIGNKVQTGAIANYLIRPVGLFRATLTEHLGSKAFAVLFEALPILLVGSLAFGVAFSADTSILLVALLIVNAYSVLFLMTYILGLTSFWYVRVFHLEFMLHNVVLQFFSGLWIPIWFFPDALRQASAWLPFDLIYFQPISALLGKTGTSDMLQELIKGYCWIAVLALVAYVVWRKAIHKLVVQGG